MQLARIRCAASGRNVTTTDFDASARLSDVRDFAASELLSCNMLLFFFRGGWTVVRLESVRWAGSAFLQVILHEAQAMLAERESCSFDSPVQVIGWTFALQNTTCCGTTEHLCSSLLVLSSSTFLIS